MNAPTELPAGSVQRPGSAVNPCMTVDECIAWAESGKMFCGARTERAVRTLAGEVLRLRETMRRIISSQPCLDNGGCFYPMHDGDGNYIGEQNVDPLAVIQSIVGEAVDALNPPNAQPLSRGENGETK